MMRRTLWPEGVRYLKHSEISWFRERLLKEQDGICPICNKEVHRACLDHSHTKRIRGTGKIRGVLCNHCNVFLSKSENNALRYGIRMADLPAVLRGMALYLERPHLPFVHPSEKPPAPKLMKSSYKELLKSGTIHKVPNYPRSGKMTKKLAKIFESTGITPRFYA